MGRMWSELDIVFILITHIQRIFLPFFIIHSVEMGEC